MNLNNSESNRIAQLEQELEMVKRSNTYLQAFAPNGSNNALFYEPQHHHVAGYGYAGDAHQTHSPAVLARSKSNIGHTSNPGSYVNGQHGFEHQAVLRTRAYSQQSPVNGPGSPLRHDGVSQFRHNGPVSPVTGSQMTRSLSTREDMLKRSPTSHGMPQRLVSVQEHSSLEGVGMHPADYIAHNRSDETYLASTRPDLSPSDVYQAQKPSACPSMYSGSSALDASPMTRHNSSFEGVSSGGYMVSTPMINSSSSQSMFADSPLWQEAGVYDVKHQGAPDQDLLGCGATFPSQECHPTAYDTNMLLPPNDSASMERTGSNTSTSSVKSNASNLEKRLKERREQVLRNSQTNQIRPKALEPSPDKAAAALKKTKVPVTKAGYARRKHPKVHCNLCSDHPEFRGDHELQRHYNAKHSTSVTKFICRDPASVGMHSDLEPKRPLKGCKSCDNGKLYGAYYNAAAHLRRWHFKPKTQRGKGRGSTEEKRGGSAGGHWPPMEDLKAWFEERVIQRSPDALEGVAESDEMEDDTAEMGADEEQDQAPVETEISSYNSVSPGYGMTTPPVPQGLEQMAPNMLAAGQMAPMTTMPDFMPFSSPTEMGAMPGSDSPMWGSSASSAFTPPFDFNNMSQGTMGSAFATME